MFAKRVVMALMFLITIFITDSYAEEVWKIASLDWQPYSGSDMASEGNSIQKLRELLKKEGITLKVDFFPWLRAKNKATKEEYVGYFPAWPEEVDRGFVASPPVDWSEVSILAQAESNVSFENIDDLFKKYKVGIVQTYVYPKDIDDAMKKYPDHVDRAPDEISLLKKLSGGRHPVAITDPNVMLYLAAKEGISNVVAMDKIVMKKELVVAMRDDAKNKSRIELLKKTLQNMEK